MSIFSKFEKAFHKVTEPLGITDGLTSDLRDYVTGETQAKISTAYQQILNEKQFEYNYALQQMAQAFNAEQAQTSREWQEGLSNTAYQRARADLEKANLNALLVTPQGASTPSGATATSPGASVGGSSVSAQGHVGEAVGAVSSLMSGIGAAMTLKSKVQQAQADVQKTVADTKLSEAQTANQAAQTELAMEKSSFLKPASNFVSMITNKAPSIGAKIGDWLGGLVGSNTDVPTSNLGGIARLAGIDTSAKGASKLEKAVKSVADMLQGAPAKNAAGSKSSDPEKEWDEKADDDWNELIRYGTKNIKRNFRETYGRRHPQDRGSYIHTR